MLSGGRDGRSITARGWPERAYLDTLDKLAPRSLSVTGGQEKKNRQLAICNGMKEGE